MTVEGERCQVCGTAYLFVYWLPDDVWAAITPKPETPGAGLLCPVCADTRAADAGLPLRWTAGPLIDAPVSDYPGWQKAALWVALVVGLTIEGALRKAARHVRGRCHG